MIIRAIIYIFLSLLFLFPFIIWSFINFMDVNEKIKLNKWKIIFSSLMICWTLFFILLIIFIFIILI